MYSSSGGATLVLENTQFINNTASSSGGGVSNQGAVVTATGAVFDQNTGGTGGAFANGNGGSTHFVQSTFRNNHATGATGGGAISTLGASMTLERSHVDRNTSDSQGGGVYSGNLIDPSNTVVLDHARLTQNSATGDGGGLYVSSESSVSIVDSAFSQNRSGSDGGGVFSTGEVNLDRSLINSNHAANEGGRGGGVFNSGENGAPGTLSVLNSTLSGNVAALGGGIYSASSALDDGPRVTLLHATVAGNRSPSDGRQLFNQGAASVVSVHNTIIGHRLPVMQVGAGPLTADCGGNVTGIASQGANIDTDNSCNFTAGNDLPSVNPMVSALAANGGPTQTHAISTGSPALGAADTAACPTIDQRGASRTGVWPGPGCDIGAFEIEVRVEPADRIVPLPRNPGDQ